jgi:hypothetical protein
MDDTPIEYLYLDQRRLDAYADQLGLALRRDKSPAWNLGIGLSGPRVGASQGTTIRPASAHQKLAALLAHLDRRRGIRSGRLEVYPNDKEVLFRIETMPARRCRIPPRAGLERQDGLNLWVSTLPDRPERVSASGDKAGALFLIEDYAGEEAAPMMLTGYSALLLLAQLFTNELRRTVLGDRMEAIEAWLDRENELVRRFAVDPLGFVADLHAQIGPERRIRSLYRVRGSCYHDYRRTMFAYPIAIREAGGNERRASRLRRWLGREKLRF